jgi:hypothetical protein
LTDRSEARVLRVYKNDFARGFPPGRSSLAEVGQRNFRFDRLTTYFVATVRLTATTLPVVFLAADASGVGAAASTGAATAPQAGSQQPLPAEQSGSPQQLSQQLALRHFFAL